MIDTQISSFDADRKIIRISDVEVDWQGPRRAIIVIFAESGIFEYDGNVRRSVALGELEIGLFRERKKEDRKNRRLPVSRTGQVEMMRVNGKWMTLRKPVGIMTINISSGGMLFGAFAGSFTVKDQIQVAVPLQSGVLRGNYEVCRVIHKNNVTEQYGCRLIAEEQEKH